MNALNPLIVSLSLACGRHRFGDTYRFSGLLATRLEVRVDPRLGRGIRHL